MICESCGAETRNGWDGQPLALCQSCSAKAGEQRKQHAARSVPSFKYHTAIKIHYFLSSLCLLIAVALLIIKASTTIEFDYPAFNMAATTLAVSALHYLIAGSLKRERTFAVFASLLSGAILLLFIPIGTVIGILLIYSFMKAWKTP